MPYHPPPPAMRGADLMPTDVAGPLLDAAQDRQQRALERLALPSCTGPLRAAMAYVIGLPRIERGVRSGHPSLEVQDRSRRPSSATCGFHAARVQFAGGSVVAQSGEFTVEQR
jgi:hypothetical protein